MLRESCFHARLQGSVQAHEYAVNCVAEVYAPLECMGYERVCLAVMLLFMVSSLG